VSAFSACVYQPPQLLLLDDLCPAILREPDEVGIKEREKIDDSVLKRDKSGCCALVLRIQVSHVLADVFQQRVRGLGEVIEKSRVPETLGPSRAIPNHSLPYRALFSGEDAKGTIETVSPDDRIDIVQEPGEPASLYVLTLVDILDVAANDFRPGKILRNQEHCAVYNVGTFALAAALKEFRNLVFLRMLYKRLCRSYAALANGSR
jgi:hypothetical protein